MRIVYSSAHTSQAIGIRVGAHVRARRTRASMMELLSLRAKRRGGHGSEGPNEA